MSIIDNLSLVERDRASHKCELTLLALMSAALFLLFFVSLLVGPVSIDLFSSEWSFFADSSSVAAVILQEIRLPRTILAIFIGATLGISGAALQGLLRNPLAEAGVIGISGSASLGAVIAFYSGAAAIFPLALPIGGITGAMLAVIFLYLLAGRESSILTLILAGIAVTSLSGALTALALNLSPNPYAATEIFFWLMGSLADRSFEHVKIAVPLMAIGVFSLLACRQGLDALALGEDTARSLGINLNHLTLRVIVGVALSVGAAVSVAGGIGFVGLVVPHLLRPLVGYQPGKLLLASALGGALLLLVADIFVRLLSTGQELKLGVLTSLIGAPFFLYLVLKTRRQLL